jgi:two-component system, NtrC family, nitrogen regulation sensor histidine kinase GlnL
MWCNEPMPAPVSPPVAAPERLDALATPLLRIDDGRIGWLNPAAGSWLAVGLRRLLGQPPAALGGVPLAELVARAPGHPEGLRAQRLRREAAGGEARFAHVLARPDGDATVWLELHPVAEFAGEDPATLLPAALSVALKGLAHEVKNPLAGLRGAAQLLQRRLGDDADAARYLEVILAETARLSMLVDRLLEPPSARPFAPTNVHEVLERVRLLAEAEAGWAVRIVRDYDPSLPPLPADPDRLVQSLWNLVRNALQAGAGEIRLRTRAERGIVIGDRAHRWAIRIEVDDDGCGVPEALAERIFLPLVSGRADGSGLGLALAQQVAREHGGSLGYRSRPGHTVFTLLLPGESGEGGADGQV